MNGPSDNWIQCDHCHGWIPKGVAVVHEVGDQQFFYHKDFCYEQALREQPTFHVGVRDEN